MDDKEIIIGTGLGFLVAVVFVVVEFIL